MPRAMLALCCALVGSAALAVPVAAAPDPPTYLPPVDAPVRDPFRPPEVPYGPGNRGLEYDTEAGDPVTAAADGTVSFSGAVGGTLHVTVLHPDGVRTSYSFLAQIDVVAGQRVRTGQVLGFTGGPLHFGARRGDEYFDPSSLFEAGPPQVHLVAFDEPPGSGPGGERRAISQLVGGLGGLVD
jgi:murein DD-endopeptidase MepM/ murein hydrolase activator NlpD